MKRKIDADIGIRLREIRTSLGLSQEAFAEQLDISIAHLSRVERGQRNMSTALILEACDALSISIDYLLFGNQEKANTDLIIEMLSNMDQEYVDDACELLKTFVLAINRKQQDPNQLPKT